MLSSSLLKAAAFALGVTAIRVPPMKFCLTEQDAKQVGQLWMNLIGNYTKADADAGLTSKYSDYSASALSLNSVCQQAPGPPQNLTSPVFTSRTIFEMAQGSQPAIPSTSLDIWHGCDTVTMRYEMCIMGNCTLPVVSLIALDIVKVISHNHY